VKSDGIAGTVVVAAVAPTAARKRHPAAALRAVAVLGLLAAGAWTFHDVAWFSVWRAVSTARPGWILAAAVLNLLAVCFQAARWLALVRPLSPAATFGRVFRSMVTGFAVSLVLPARAGELIRTQSLTRRTGIPASSVLASIALDFLVNAAGLLVGLTLLPLCQEVPSWVRSGAWATAAGVALGVALLWALRSSVRAATGVARRLPIKTAASLLAGARHGLSAASRPTALGLSLGASLASWSVEVAVIAAATRAVGLDLPLSADLMVLLAVNLALAYPVAPPGNIGTLEMGATLALMGLGVAKEQALTFGLVYHALQAFPIAALGAFFAARAREGAASA
jgi:uncharacterized protein (TIRG00374 family)